MTDTSALQTTVQPENVGRGALFALATIPISVLVFAIFGWLGVFPFIIGILMPFVAAWLYRKGSGGQLTRRGWAPYIAISLVAVLIGALAASVAGIYKVFGFGSGFMAALAASVRRFDLESAGFTVGLGVVLGVIGIVLALRQKNTTPAQQIAATTAQWTPPPAATPPPASAAADAPPAPEPEQKA